MRLIPATRPDREEHSVEITGRQKVLLTLNRHTVVSGRFLATNIWRRYHTMTSKALASHPTAVDEQIYAGQISRHVTCKKRRGRPNIGRVG
jgi:hypothetical protein